MKDVVSIRDISDKLKEFRMLLRRRWLTISISVIVFGMAGLAISMLIKPRYTSKLTFVLEESANQQGLGGLAGLASQFGFSASTGSSTFTQDNIVEILKSRNIVQKSLLAESTIGDKKDLLINHYLTYRGYYEEWEDNPRLKSLRYKVSDESQLTYLHDSIMMIVYKEISNGILDVYKLKNMLGIIEIKAVSTDEEFSKQLTENLVKTVSDFYITTKTQRAKETFEFLQKRADSTKTALDGALLELARWQDASNQLVKYQAQTERAKLLRNVEILQVVYSEILKNLEISKMTLMNITPLVKIIDRPILPLEVFRITPFAGILMGGGLGFLLTLIYMFISMLITDALKEKE